MTSDRGGRATAAEAPVSSSSSMQNAARLARARDEGIGAELASIAAVPETASPLDGFAFRPHNCFACGELNANGLRLNLHLEPGRCWTELAPDSHFEGWEGVVHGGILCTILDEVMAWSLVEQDNWGVTVRLNVEFRRPVVVGQAIRAEGWITEARRRIQKTSGQIVDAASGQELVRADAVYVAAAEEKKRELKQRYAYREERVEAMRAAATIAAPGGAGSGMAQPAGATRRKAGSDE